MNFYLIFKLTTFTAWFVCLFYLECKDNEIYSYVAIFVSRKTKSGLPCTGVSLPVFLGIHWILFLNN